MGPGRLGPARGAGWARSGAGPRGGGGRWPRSPVPAAERGGSPAAELPCPPPPGCDVCAPLGGRRGVPGGEEGS